MQFEPSFAIIKSVWRLENYFPPPTYCRESHVMAKFCVEFRALVRQALNLYSSVHWRKVEEGVTGRRKFSMVSSKSILEGVWSGNPTTAWECWSRDPYLSNLCHNFYSAFYIPELVLRKISKFEVVLGSKFSNISALYMQFPKRLSNPWRRETIEREFIFWRIAAI